MKYKKNVLLFLFIIIASKAFAAAGFADQYYDHQRWIFPAYAYCLGFGLVTLLILTLISFIFKAKTNSMIVSTSNYLKEHDICGIVVSGTQWAILLGIIGSVFWDIIWFLAIIPILVLMIGFPLVQVNRKIRVKWLLSPQILKWTAMFTISAIIASVLFIFFTSFGILNGTDNTYLTLAHRIHNDFYISKHPFDSIMEIWEMPLLFIAEIIIAIFLFYLGSLMRYISREFSLHRNTKANEL